MLMLYVIINTSDSLIGVNLDDLRHVLWRVALHMELYEQIDIPEAIKRLPWAVPTLRHWKGTLKLNPRDITCNLERVEK